MVTVEGHEKLCRLVNACRQGADNTTPMSLVQEMVNKIPEEIWKDTSATILDPAAGTGSFLVAAYWKMIEAGDTHENIISNRLFACEINLVYLKIIKDKLGIKNIYNKDFLQLDLDMKFDVIIGNPPYNHPGESNNQLYQHFWNKGFELADIVSFVLPYNMIEGLKKGNIDKTKVNIYTPQFIKTNIHKKYFKGIGVDILYFVCDKNIKNGTTVVKDALSDFETTLNIFDIPVSAIESKEKYEFVKKHFKKENTYKILSGDASKTEQVGNDIMVLDNVKKDGRLIAKPSKKFLTDPYRPKILFNILNSGKADEFVIDEKGTMLPSGKHNVQYIVFDSVEEMTRLASDLNSDRFSKYRELFPGRSVIQTYVKDVFV